MIKYLLCSLVFFASCAQQERREANAIDLNDILKPEGDTSRDYDLAPEDQYATPEEFAAQSRTVDQKAAVFYAPSKEFREMFQSRSKEDYAFLEETFSKQLKRGHQFTAGKKLPVIEVKDKSYIKCILADKSFEYVSIDSLEDPWGLIFFDPARKPKVVNIGNIETEYNNYFR